MFARTLASTPIVVTPAAPITSNKGNSEWALVHFWSIFLYCSEHVTWNLPMIPLSAVGRIFSFSRLLPLSQISCYSILWKKTVLSLGPCPSNCLHLPPPISPGNTFAFFKSQFKCHFLRKTFLDPCWLVWLPLLYAPLASWRAAFEIVILLAIMYSVSVRPIRPSSLMWSLHGTRHMIDAQSMFAWWMDEAFQERWSCVILYPHN